MGALRGAMTILGPVSWAWLATDLALKSVGTDHARVIQVVCALAQIRLLRTCGGWQPPEGPHPQEMPASSPAVHKGHLEGSYDMEVYGL